MQTYSNEDKIERYLDDLAVEYKELLLKRLLEVSGTIENLSVSELLRIDTEIKKPLLAEYRRQQRRQRAMLMAGMLYAIMGIMLLTMFEMIDSFRYDGVTLVALVITFLGLLMSLMSVMIPNSKNPLSKHEPRSMEDNRAIWEYSVVKTWRELEGIAADIYAESKTMPTHSIISKFLEDNYINKVEAERLREFLKMRNNIVHDTDNNYKLEEIKNALKGVESIINSLKKDIL